MGRLNSASASTHEERMALISAAIRAPHASEKEAFTEYEETVLEPLRQALRAKMAQEKQESPGL